MLFYSMYTVQRNTDYDAFRDYADYEEDDKEYLNKIRSLQCTLSERPGGSMETIQEQFSCTTSVRKSVTVVGSGVCAIMN